MTLPDDTTPRPVVTVEATGIAAALELHGIAGAVLVVADDAAIAAWAPAWAAAFAATGRPHRVVVPGVDVVAAAAGLDAGVVVAAGATADDTAALAAAALDVPLVKVAPSS